MTYDLLFFGVFCLLMLGFFVRQVANKKYLLNRELRHPIYELREKSIEEISNEDRKN